MPVSKVVYGSDTLIDLTADTVTASDLLKGVTAHGADGEAITGTLEPSGTSQVTYHYLKAVRPSYSASGTTTLNNAKGATEYYLGKTGTCNYTFDEGQELIGFMWADGSRTENRYLKTLTIEYSDDNSTWSTLLSTSTSSHGSYERTATSQGAHKYWRVSWTGNSNPSECMCDFIGILK